MNPSNTPDIEAALLRFAAWLDRYGETSWDHQSYFAGPLGRAAKTLYYRHPRLGIAAVAPMIFSEAFLPSARRLFWKRQRFPIADAHYAMGFAQLAQLSGHPAFYRRAVHFLEILEETRSPGYRHRGWGYPFDWVTRNGVFPAGTPLITSTPYAYEAFAAVYALDGDRRWLNAMYSAAEHAATDIPDRVLSDESASAGYEPGDTRAGVVNASAYRAFLLTDAAERFGREDYRRLAGRNLRFVLDAQQPDGSWFYAMDGVRDFVDHYHTCFVLKALAKIERLTGDPGCGQALEAGLAFYQARLFDDRGLPKPFARAPRLTVYRQELYDYAECINLGALLRGRDPALDLRVEAAVADLLGRWQTSAGPFRARRLLLGWDGVPMHRWGQAQAFRSLGAWCLAARAEARRDHAASGPALAAARPAARAG